MISLKMLVLPLLALIVIASLPRPSETQAPTITACAATLPTDAQTGRRQVATHSSKPPCEPGRGQLALARTN